jgi:hypothetical protein
MRIAPFFVVAAALSLSACFPPTTTHPAGTTVGLANDPALVGLWRGKMHNDEDRAVYFHFLPADDGHITVVLVQSGAEPDGDWSVASITTATLGNNHLMNAQLTFSDGHADEDDASHGSVPVLYRFEGNRLVLYLMDEDATKAAIRAHQIAGTVEDGQFGDATITAAPKELDAFLASRKGAALFGERFATLTRMD